MYFVAKAALYAIGVPPWQAPDETLHFEVAELRLRAGPGVGGLVVDPYLEEEIVASLGQHDFWRLTGQIEPDPPPRTLGSTLVGSALPVYYNILALLFRLAPSGDVLSRLYIGRIASVLFCGLSLIVTVSLARQLFPHDTAVAFGTGAVLAFVPQVGFMAGTLSPDPLVMLLGSAACWLGAAVILHGPTARSRLLIPLTCVLCLLTKRNLYFLVPLLALCPMLAITGARKRRALWWILAAAAAVAVLVVGPIRSAASRSLHQATLNIQMVGESPPGWWSSAVATFWRSSLASLGWLRLHANWRWYQAAAVFPLAATVGLITVLVRWSAGRLDVSAARGRALVWLALVACLGAGQVVLGLGLTGEELPQGRHLFPAVPAVAILLVLGLRMVVPWRSGPLLIIAAAAFLLAFDVWVMWRVAIPGFYL